MSEKYINNANYISAGYKLDGANATIVVGPLGTIGGPGVQRAATLSGQYTMSNEGVLLGSRGATLGKHGVMGAAAVTWAGPGRITNDAGTITGGAGGDNSYDVKFAGPPGVGGTGILLTVAATVRNDSGSIIGGAGGAARYAIYDPALGGEGGTGISLTHGGVIVNDDTILGGTGGNGGYAFEFGQAGGAGGAGAFLADGGTVINHSLIAGGAGGPEGVPPRSATGGHGAIGDGVILSSGGAVINGHTALISGRVGVYAGSTGAATITNYGAIVGHGENSVAFKSTADRLIVESGASFGGAAVGGGGTLELAGGNADLTGLGGSGALHGDARLHFSGFGAYIVDTGAALRLAGTNSLGSGQTLTNDGTLRVVGALNNSGGTMANSGRMIVAGGVVMADSVVDGGAEIVTSGGLASATIVHDGGRVYIAAGGEAVAVRVSRGGEEVVSSGGVVRGATVSAGGVEAVVAGGIDSHTVVNSGGKEYLAGGTASNLVLKAGAALDIAAVKFGAGTRVAFTASTDILTVSDGVHTAKIQLFGQYVTAGFQAKADGAGNTLVTYAPPHSAADLVAAIHS